MNISVGSFILHILSIVFTIENLYAYIEQLKMKLRTCLGVSLSKEERRKIKLQIGELDALKPMTAKGYFIVSKETLTSMLSVR